MLRKLVLLVSALSLALIGVATINCGSTSNSTIKPCTGGPFNVVGDWNGTFTGSNGTTTAVGAIDSSGLAAFFDSTGDTALLPAITGTCSFSGTETLYASFLNGGTTLTGTAQGNVNSTSSITGTETVNNASGTFTLASSAPLSVAPTAFSGPGWIGQVGGGGDLLSLTFTPTGTGVGMTFTGIDITTNCTVSGAFTQQGTSNVFDIAYNIAASGTCTASTFKGIGFESSTDYFTVNGNQAGTYLYADIQTSSGAFALEIYP